MSTIYLVRHTSSSPDPALPEPLWPLSTAGRAQARALAPFLATLGVKRLYASPYPRAVDTLRPFAEHSGLEITLDHDLRERKLCEGAREDWLELLRRAWSDFSFALPGCESSRMAQDRMLAAVERVAARHPGETLAIGSHGNVIGLVLNALDPSFGFERWRTLRNPDVVRLVSNGGGLIWDEAFTFPRDLAPPPRSARVTSSVLAPTEVAALVGCERAAVTLLHRGFNDSFVIAGKDVVLRVYRHDWRSLDEIEAELALVSALAELGLPVARPGPFPDGRFVATVEAPEGRRWAAQFAKAPGNLPLPVTPALSLRLGTTLGRMHAAFDRLGTAHARPALDAQTLAAGPLATLTQHFPQFATELAGLRGVVDRLLETIDRAPVAAKARGLVHGDFIPVNLFDHESGPTLFDFDFCGVSWRAYDLASWQWAVGGADEAAPLFRAYEKETGLAFEPPAIEALAALRQLWVWGVGVEYGDDFRRLNPHQFRHRLQYFERFM